MSDNVIPIRRRVRDCDEVIRGKFVKPSDVRELVALMSDSTGTMSVVFTPVPDGQVAWEIAKPDQLDQLALYLVQLGVKLRGTGSPP